VYGEAEQERTANVGKVVFPAFSNNEDVSPQEVRQLVSALEYRFQLLEQESGSLFNTGDTNDLDNRYALLGHTHSESEITDLQDYLTDITAESIFDLSDVTGTPQQGYTLVWNNTLQTFEVVAPGAASFSLNDLTDVEVPAPNDGEVLVYSDTSNTWVAGSAAGITSFVGLTDTDLDGQAQYDLVFNATGSEWHDTGGKLRWNPNQFYLELANAHTLNIRDSGGAGVPMVELSASDVAAFGDPGYPSYLDGTRMNLRNDIGLNWDDGAGTPVELGILTTGVPGGTPDPDPDIGSVTFLLTAANFAITTTGGSGGWNPTSGIKGSVDLLTPGYVEPSLYFGQALGNEQRGVSSDQSKFSDRSFYVNGTTGANQSYLEIRPSSGTRTAMNALPGWNLSNQPFTLECHVYLPSGDEGSDAPLITVWNQTGVSDMFRWELTWNGIGSYWEVRFAFSTTGSNQVTVFSQVGNDVVPDTWHHVAITRDSSDNWRYFVDGVLDAGPVNQGGTIVAPNAEHWLQIMSWDNDIGNTEMYADNFRITQGVARYTTNFTPPTGPYDGSTGEERFVLGDPGFDTIIDGANTNVTGTMSVDLKATFSDDVDILGTLEAAKAISGDPGTEGTSVQINNVAYESSGMVSDIGGTNESQLLIHRHSDTYPAVLLGTRSKSNTDAHTVVADNDILLNILAAGWDGVDTYSLASEIRFNVDGTPGNNDMPGEISFLTAADGTQVPLERGRFRASGAFELIGPAGSGFSSTSHDDTDLTTVFTNTTDWNIDTLTALNFGADVGLEWNDELYVERALGGAGDAFYNDIGVLLHFNGTDGATSTTDSGPNALTPITFNGTAQLDNAQVKFGSTSLLLDGNSDYLNIGDNADLKINTTDDFTIECWARFNALGSNVIVNKGGINGVSWPNYTFGMNPSNQAYFFVYQNGGTNVNVTSSALSTGQWYHLAGTWDAATGTCELYVDGVSQGTSTNGALVPYSTNTNDFNIGHQPSGVGDYFDGWIDDLRVTFGVRRYTTNFTPPAAEFEDFQQAITFIVGNLTDRVDVNGTEVQLIGDVIADDTLTSTSGVWTFAQTTGSAVFNLAGSLDNDPDLGGNQDAQFNFTNASGTEIGDMAWTSGPSLRLRNLVHDGNVIIAGQDSGGLDRNMIVADPSTGVELYFDTNLSARTVSSANGGLQADNTATGAGLERVLTTSDLASIADGTTDNAMARWDVVNSQWEEETSWLLSETGVLTLDEGSFGKTVTFSHDGFDYNIVPGINTRDIIFGDTTGDGDFTTMRIHNCNVIISDSSPSMGVNIGSRTISGANVCEFVAFGTAGILTGVDWYFNTEGNTNWFRISNSTAIAGNNTLEFGTDNTAEIMRYVGRSGGTDPYYFDIKLIEDVATSGEVAMRIKNNNIEFARFDIGTGTNFFRLSGTGTEFRHESGTAGWDRYFSGALAITDFANVTDWRIQGLTGDVEIMDGRGLTCVSAGGSNAVAIRHDGTDVNWTHAVTTDWNIAGITNVRLNDVGLAIGNAGETADAVFAHDGTDLNVTFLATSDINWDGATRANFFKSNAGGYWLRIGEPTTVHGANGTAVFDMHAEITSTIYGIRQNLSGASFNISSLSGVTTYNVGIESHFDSGLYVDDGSDLRVRDSTNNDYVNFAHDGTDLLITEQNTTNIVFPAAGTLGLDMTDNTILTPILQDNATEADSPTVTANAVTLTYSNGPMFEVDLEPATATVAVTISGGPPSGTHGRIIAKFQQDGATAQTLTWAGGTFRWDGGTAHPMNSTLDGFSIYFFDTWDGGTTWYGSGADFS
jgi:hypothetical protein